MFYRILKFISNEIIYNGHLQSLGASGIVYTASVLLGYPIAINLLVITYLIFQTIYFHDRYQGFYHDRATNAERTAHIKKYYHILPLIIFTILIITAGALFYIAAYPVLIFSAVILIFGFLYPVVFKKITKYVPLFKNFYVASVFALMAFSPSIYWRGEIVFSSLSVVLFLFVFAEAMIAQIVLDIKDWPSDKQQGLLTLPVLLKMNQVIMVLWSMSFIVFIIALFSLIFTPSFRLIGMLATITFIFNGYMLFNVSHNEKRGYVLSAGKYLLWPLVLIVLSYA